MILIVGDVMLDRYFWGVVTRISPEAPVPIVQIIKTSYALGGAANVAANVVGMWEEAVLIGATGKDHPAEALAQLLRNYGITDYLISEKDRPTTMKTRVIAGSQQLLRIDNEEVRPLFKKGVTARKSNIARVIDNCGAVIISDYGKGMIDAEVIDYIKEQAQCPIFVDPKGNDWEKYTGVTCITPNFQEFLSYCDFLRIPIASEVDLRRAAKEVVGALKLEYLVITRGADGMIVVPSKGKIYHAEVEHVEEVLDVSGAGDTVIAALAVATASGKSMVKAADYANKAAGIVVSRLGTSPIEKVDRV
jgi:D-beta-D-heptose 7-phosphate kinase/D-beta-D-heptose 1-phosphate adenosyltransferase